MAFATAWGSRGSSRPVARARSQVWKRVSEHKSRLAIDSKDWSPNEPPTIGDARSVSAKEARLGRHTPTGGSVRIRLVF